MSVRIIVSDALTALRTLESESVQCVVTSPPYFNLRDYGTATWDGGDPSCNHLNGALASSKSTLAGYTSENVKLRTGGMPFTDACGKCDAVRIDQQIGLEQTPAAFIAALVAVFDEVKRVLRPDGLCFVNLGDSYSGSGKGPSGANGIGDQEQRQGFVGSKQRTNAGSVTMGSHEHEYRGVPAKNLLLIPERFAIAMQDAGWWVRSRIAWCKTSAMPESVRDRPTSAWEHIWMFSRSKSYFYDADAVRVPWSDERNGASGTKSLRYSQESGRNGDSGLGGEPPFPGANLRNYWLLGPEPSREEHYAAYPSELPRRCILAGSRKGDTVLDPFSGSGTTAMVADRLGRDAIGIELNPEYAEMSRRRIERDAGGLFGETVEVEPAATQQPLWGRAAS